MVLTLRAEVLSKKIFPGLRSEMIAVKLGACIQDAGVEI